MKIGIISGMSFQRIVRIVGCFEVFFLNIENCCHYFHEKLSLSFEISIKCMEHIELKRTHYSCFEYSIFLTFHILFFFLSPSFISYKNVLQLGLRNFECSICQTPFVSRQALNKHTTKHHNGSNYDEN